MSPIIVNGGVLNLLFHSHRLYVSLAHLLIFYETTFIYALQQRQFPYDNFSVCKERLMLFTWQLYTDHINMQLEHDDYTHMKKQCNAVWIGSRYRITVDHNMLSVFENEHPRIATLLLIMLPSHIAGMMLSQLPVSIDLELVERTINYREY